jgi:hypothetical protein
MRDRTRWLRLAAGAALCPVASPIWAQARDTYADTRSATDGLTYDATVLGAWLAARRRRAA